MAQAEKIQTTQATSIIKLKKSGQHQIPTNESKCQGLQLKIINGLIRLYCVNEQNNSESTLAILQQGKTCSLTWNNHRKLMIESLEACNVEIHSKDDQLDTNDFLSNWILDLYEIKQPADSLERLMKLLLMLAKTTINLGSAPDPVKITGLSHRRIGEMISSTRPTVSRHLSWMQRQKLITVDSSTKTMQLDILRLRAKQQELFAQPRPHLH